ncbi:hypothetical protein BN903_262 [Halorubrum sp. AJ67]|nr:hypothetical protein BN903_262 [Halorubrum sp. AJ67]
MRSGIHRRAGRWLAAREPRVARRPNETNVDLPYQLASESEYARRPRCVYYLLKVY